MDPQPALEHRAQVEAFQRKHHTALLTLLFTDLVGSTRLKHDLGDSNAVALMQQHHALLRDILARFPEAEEISTSGDSFFLVFTKPSDAVRFSLLLQNKLRVPARDNPHPLLDRIGIHVGEVIIEERADAAKPKDLYGIQVDACARVMSLAEAGQILLPRAAFDSARQVLKGRDIEGLGPLSWLNHGPYVLKGVEEPLEICEVGETSAAPLKPPPDSEKVHRHVSPDSEPVLGWRPAIGQAVPNTRWVLEEKLGEGGFGEVWLGRHETLKERRVFKFCFRADRVRSLRREVTLFRVLKEKAGKHPHIVVVEDVYFDEPPYYLMMEYVPGRDLPAWCEAQGGLAKVPVETRLEIVAQMAEALQAAHEAGVIHRDVKPSNILIQSSSRGNEALFKSEIGNPKTEIKSEPPHVGCYGVQAKLTDFGIGQVVSQEVLAGMTQMGFTQTMMTSGTQSGSQMYMAPELLAGQPASPRSDLYSLGVVLYQLLVGDFARPVTTDWAKAIEDPLLREDLQQCFAGDVQERFASTGQLAVNLRSLAHRHVKRAAEQAAIAARERAAYRRGLVRATAVGAAIVAVMAGLLIFAVRQTKVAKDQRQLAETARGEAEHNLYAASMNLAQGAWEESNISRLRGLLEETRTYPKRGFEWYYWQRQTHLELRTLRGHENSVASVAFSPDGRRIVTGSGDKTTKVWDAETGRELFALNGHTEFVASVSFSLDGRRIVTGSVDETAKVWDAENGRELLTLKGHKGSGISGELRIPDGGGRRMSVGEHTGAVMSVSFASDGRRIVTGSWDRTAKVWDAETGRELLTLKGHTAPVWSVAFFPDSRRIATGSLDKTAKLWDAETGRELLTLKGHAGWISSVAFSPDGQRIVTGSFDKTAKLWDAGNGRELLILKGHTEWVTSVAFSPDGRRIVTGSDDKTAKVWDAENGRELLTFKGHDSGINLVTFSPDGRRIVTGSGDKTAKVWDAENGHELPALKGHNDYVMSVTFSPDGRRIATGSQDKTAKLWDAENGHELLTLKGHNKVIYSIVFSPDGRRIVTGSFDKTAKLWDAATGRELLTLKGHTEGVNSVAFSPDGRRIVTGGYDKTAKVWDSETGRELLTLKGHNDTIWSVSFSPDGRRIVTGSMDKTAKLWDAENGHELLTLKGHNDFVYSITFAPDGRRILTGSFDRTAKLWDAENGRELLTLKGHNDYVMSVVFSPDGRRIVTGSNDRTARVWMTASPEEVEAWRKEEQGH